MSMERVEIYPNTQRGATRQRRQRPSLEPVLKEMMKTVDNPHEAEDRQTVRERFMQFMHSTAGAQFRETTYLYWFTNFYKYHLADYPLPGEEISEREARKQEAKTEKERSVAELAQRVEKAVETKAQIMLLDLVMPNGKKLRESNRNDCKHAGGWYMKLADRLKGKQIVGDVWKEAEVRKLLPTEQRAA